MQEREASGVVVEVCPDCSGMWIDWFDGELATVAAQAGPLPRAGPHSERGNGACPKCRAHLEESRYSADGPVVFRCGECAGAFVSRDSVDRLVALGPVLDTLEHPSKPVWLALIDRLRHWLGGPQ
jgi:Zn-finger nucleic acid-binding protein